MAVYVNEELVEQGEYWEKSPDSRQLLNAKGMYLESGIREVSVAELMLHSSMVSLAVTLATCMLCELAL